MLDAATLTTTTAQLSNLADVLVDGLLRIASAELAARKGGRYPAASLSSPWASWGAAT